MMPEQAHHLVDMAQYVAQYLRGGSTVFLFQRNSEFPFKLKIHFFDRCCSPKLKQHHARFDRSAPNGSATLNILRARFLV
mgnify:CR=1 FL=1